MDGIAWGELPGSFVPFVMGGSYGQGFVPFVMEETMKQLCRSMWPVFLVALWAAGCGGARDPVVEMQRSLASAPDYMILLEDMREEGSFFPDYYHRYKIIQGEREIATDWVAVPESTYRQYENFLGMALASKTDQGVDNTPHPPGYHYVGNSQYGQWQNQGGNSFWVFYGQYAMMRSLMGWGGRSIYRNDWNDYRTHRQRGGGAYYGRNKEWGTEGSVTKARKPTFYERRKQRIANRSRSFSQKVQSRAGRSRSGFGSRSRGGFGK